MELRFLPALKKLVGKIDAMMVEAGGVWELTLIEGLVEVA